MRQSQPSVLQTLGRIARKLFLSVFVIFTFLVYAVHERLAGPSQTASANGLPAAPQPTAAVVSSGPANPTASSISHNTGPAAQPTTQSAATQPGAPQPTAAAPTDVPPTAAPQPTATAAGQYKDGQYTGARVDAFYGWVQVQAVVQNGQIADVKFLQYPSDRRTSQRINSIAMPYLTNEAIQAQSANVDIISGATLTSEAFVQSLQAALQNAAS